MKVALQETAAEDVTVVTTSAAPAAVNVEKRVKVAACGDVGSDDDHDHDHDDDDELEMEEMFVDAHPSFQHGMVEWGGPRRGGRFPEPTRYGDWERKGRCSDF